MSCYHAMWKICIPALHTHLRIMAVVLAFLASMSAPPSFAEEAPAPEKNSAPEKTASIIRTEGFTHKDFARIIFRTGKSSDFQTNLKDGKLTVTFDSPVKVDFTELLTTLKDHLISAVSGADANSVVLTLKQPDTKIRRFIGEDFIGLDLVAEPAVASVTAPEETPEIVAVEAPPAPATAANAPVAIVPTIAKTSVDAPAEPAKTTRNQPRSILPNIPTKPAPSAAPSAAINTKQTVLIPTFKPDATPAFPWLDPTQHKPAPRQIIQATPAPLPDEIEEEKPTAPSAAEDATAKAEEEKKKHVLTVGRQSLESGIILTFPWAQETAAAVFTRGKDVWAVFNAPIRLDISNIRGIKYIDSLQQIAHKRYTILRIKLPEAYIIDRTGTEADVLSLHTDKEGYEWSIALQEDEALAGSTVNNPVIAESGLREGRAAVFLPITQLGDALTLTDNDIGDTVMVFPIVKPQTGIAPEHRYVDFSLLKTAQGIVLRKNTDAVSYRVLPSGLELSSVDQLNISPELFKVSSDANPAQQQVRSKKTVLPSQSVFPFKPKDVAGFMATKKDAAHTESTEEPEDEHAEASADHPEEKTEADDVEKAEAALTPKEIPLRFADKPFIDLRDELYSVLTQASEAEKSDKRLEIAKFYFQEGLYAEALGVLNEIKILDPIYLHMYEVDLMIAASNYLQGRYGPALEQFRRLGKEASGIASYDELRLWEWASQYKMTKGEMKKETEDMPVDYLTAQVNFMQMYPPELRHEFGLLATEAKLERGEIEGARYILENIARAEDMPTKHINDTKFLQAALANAQNNVEEAAALWEEISKDVYDRYNRARAAFELTKLKLVHGQISVTEAVEIFGQLAVVWRGDNFELDLLKLVGQLYVREGNYLEGLRAWSVLVQNFPNTKEAIYIAGKMKKLFVELFDEGEAYKLPPKDALALYFEFRDLTPVGERGDRIIQQLAEHFIKADLLDNASALLQHQIEYRASGTQKNDLVLKLSELHLTNKKPQKTLESLEFLDKTAADEATLRAAKYLKARAELTMNQYLRVLDTLQDDFSGEAQKIRLDVFWYQQNWFGIIHIIESKLDALRETAPFPLKSDEVEDIIKLSVSYGTQEEREKLRMLKRDFADRIDSEKIQNIFGFVTNDIPTINYKRFDETVQLQEIESFMNEYAFWPGKDWQNVANVLQPQADALTQAGSPLTREDELNVIRLALAYAMLTHSEDPQQVAAAEKALSRLNRDFRSVTVNRNTLDVFAVLDDKFIKKTDDAVFEGKVLLKDIPTFVEQYQAAQSISELNAVVNQ